MTTKLRFFAVLSATVFCASLFAAEEKKSEPAKEIARAAPSDAKTPEAKPAADADKSAVPAATESEQVITLPAVQVTRSRIRQIDITIKRLDKLIAREKKQLKSTESDRALNNDRISNAAALFGGYSTAQRTAVAAERVRLLESERELLEQMKAPMTRENFLLVEQHVEMLRTQRRELDIVYR